MFAVLETRRTKFYNRNHFLKYYRNEYCFAILFLKFFFIDFCVNCLKMKKKEEMLEFPTEKLFKQILFKIIISH